jgi:hypothetical protein
MVLQLKRGLDAKTQCIPAINLEGVVTSSQLFAVLEEQVEELLDGSEKVVQVDVKWLSNPPTAKMMTPFTIMTPGEGRSWNDLLEDLQDHYDETRAFVKVRLEATILVLKGLSTPVTVSICMSLQ